MCRPRTWSRSRQRAGRCSQNRPRRPRPDTRGRDTATMSGRDASAGGLAGLLAHRGLLLVASGGAMAEAGLLLAVAPAARALAPQLTAVAPLAVYHDLRWLYGDDGKISGTLIG